MFCSSAQKFAATTTTTTTTTKLYNWKPLQNPCFLALGPAWNPIHTPNPSIFPLKKSDVSMVPGRFGYNPSWICAYRGDPIRGDIFLVGIFHLGDPKNQLGDSLGDIEGNQRFGTLTYLLEQLHDFMIHKCLFFLWNFVEHNSGNTNYSNTSQESALKQTNHYSAPLFHFNPSARATIDTNMTRHVTSGNHCLNSWKTLLTIL